MDTNYAPSSYTPISSDDFEFPVAVSFLCLSQLSMHMIRWHWHEEIEFLLVHSGTVKVQLPDETLVLSPGEGIFITQNLLHSIQGDEKEECSLYVLKFHPSFLFGYGQTRMTAKYLTPVLSSPALRYVLLKKEHPDTARMLSLIRNTLDCCFSENYGYELKVRAYLCSLWYRLLSFTPAAADGASFPSAQYTADSVRVKEAILFIEKKHMEPLTLKEIADSIHLSKSECCRCFQRSLGLTPFEYLMKYRIFESTRKMMRGDECASSIASLAASVGFNSTSYYNKVFKKYLNCTPTEYKKNITESAKNPEDSY